MKGNNTGPRKNNPNWVLTENGGYRKINKIDDQRISRLPNMHSSNPHIEDIMDAKLLKEMIDNKFVGKRDHPKYPLSIYNYTKTTQFAQEWNPVTIQCRGLIVDDKGIIVARPFKKFFNYGQEKEGAGSQLRMNVPVEVTDKLDGSMGIMYPTPDGYAISTRGDFRSPQSQHATKLLREKYNNGKDLNPEITYHYEIIYKEGRIVLDYGDEDDLYLLGGIVTATGEKISSNDLPWDGPRTETLDANTFAEALELPPRKNAEGVVVTYLDTGDMVKIKQEDYMLLHKAQFSLTEGKLWEAMQQGKLNDIIESVPDEMQDWIKEKSGKLDKQFNAIKNEVISTRDKEIANFKNQGKDPLAKDRGEFAQYLLKSYPRARLMLSSLGKTNDRMGSIDKAIWKEIKPLEGGEKMKGLNNMKESDK